MYQFNISTCDSGLPLVSMSRFMGNHLTSSGMDVGQTQSYMANCRQPRELFPNIGHSPGSFCMKLWHNQTQGKGEIHGFHSGTV